MTFVNHMKYNANSALWILRSITALISMRKMIGTPFRDCTTEEDCNRLEQIILNRKEQISDKQVLLILSEALEIVRICGLLFSKLESEHSGNIRIDSTDWRQLGSESIYTKLNEYLGEYTLIFKSNIGRYDLILGNLSVSDYLTTDGNSLPIVPSVLGIDVLDRFDLLFEGGYGTVFLRLMKSI